MRACCPDVVHLWTYVQGDVESFFNQRWGQLPRPMFTFTPSTRAGSVRCMRGSFYKSCGTTPSCPFMMHTAMVGVSPRTRNAIRSPCPRLLELLLNSKRRHVRRYAAASRFR